MYNNTNNNPFINTTAFGTSPYAQCNLGNLAGIGAIGSNPLNAYQILNTLNTLNSLVGVNGLNGFTGVNPLIAAINNLAGFAGAPAYEQQTISPFQLANAGLGLGLGAGAGAGAAVGVGAGAINNVGRGTPWVPGIHVSENETVLQIAVELPGVKEQDVEITINGNVLTIHGEKTCSSFGTQTVTRYAEFCAGSFYRSIQLAETPVIAEERYDISHVGAEFQNGMLIVTIPKSHEGRTQFKRVDVSKRSKSNATA